MKRAALLATLALVVVTPAVASAAPSKAASSRTITSDYKLAPGFSVTDGLGGAFGCNGPIDGCWEFTTTKGEKKVTVTAADSSGTPVGIQIFSDDDYSNNVKFFCGTGTIDLSPKSAHAVGVRVAYSASCAAFPAGGKLKAVISNNK